jgi:uncharacterized protein (DUF169 family)
MTITEKDLAILSRFEFDMQPVGIKYLVKRPDTIERLPENMALCEMLKKALEGNAFYADKENHTCGAGTYVLGETESPEPFTSGQFGAGLQIYDEPRSASRPYYYLPRIKENVAHYVVFSPLDKLSFDPDLLIILAKTSQSEILLRAMSYKTGTMWSSKMTAAIGCAWLFVYPYINGELNYTTGGFGHGMKRRNLFPEGHQLISIPFDLLPSILQNLQEMPWELPAYKPDGLEFVKQLLIDLGVIPPR